MDGLNSPTDFVCESNDISIATATVVSATNAQGDVFGPTDDITCVEGEDITLTLDATLLQTAASARTDIGIWIATDGGDAQTGDCNHYNLVNGVTGVANLDNDSCGDMNSAQGTTQVSLTSLVVQCVPNEDNKLHIGSCLGWTVPGSDDECPTDATTGADAFRWATLPNNKTKCNCEGFDLDITVLKSATIEVIKECPAGTTGSFDLEIDGNVEEENAACGGTTGAIEVSAGTNTEPGDDHNVSESGFTTANYHSSYACTRNGDEFTSGTGTSVADFEVMPDDVIVCTFTNEAIEVDVSKTAVESFTRSYTWNIDKSAGADTEIELDPGQVYDHAYSVTASVATTTDDDFAVEGVITITNPTSATVTVNSVSDNIAGVGAATVTCEGITFPYELAAGDDFECTYESALPDGTTRVNTASVTLAGPADPFTGTANVDFTGITPAYEDNCLVVKDEGDLGNTDPLGTVCVSGTPAPGGAFTAPKTFNYTRTVPTGPAQCGRFEYDNTATGTTNTSSTVITDAATIGVTINCPQGCTLTQGYWKTHNQSFRDARNGRGPAPDDAWFLLGALGEDTPFYSSGQTWFQVFMTAPKGNVYYVLAHQYMAAKLNVLDGVTPTTEVANAITAAEALFAAYTPATAGALKGNNPNRTQFITLAGILGAFNEGLAGVDHCSEDAASTLQ